MYRIDDEKCLKWLSKIKLRGTIMIDDLCMYVYNSANRLYEERKFTRKLAKNEIVFFFLVFLYNIIKICLRKYNTSAFCCCCLL